MVEEEALEHEAAKGKSAFQGPHLQSSPKEHGVEDLALLRKVLPPLKACPVLGLEERLLILLNSKPTR